MTVDQAKAILERPKVTGDELVARVRADMGYVAMPSFSELQVGQIVKPNATRSLKCVTPFRVVGKSTKRHLMRQRRYVLKIAPYADVVLETEANHFYLIEAAD